MSTSLEENIQIQINALWKGVTELQRAQGFLHAMKCGNQKLYAILDPYKKTLGYFSSRSRAERIIKAYAPQITLVVVEILLAHIDILFLRKIDSPIDINTHQR